MNTKLDVFKDFCLMMAHLAFYPLAYFTMLPSMREDLLGISQRASIEGLFWIALCVCGYVVLGARTSTGRGPLANFGAIVFTVGLCVLTPVMMAFTAMALVTFAGGGFQAVAIWWKAALFFLFLWLYLNPE